MVKEIIYCDRCGNECSCIRVNKGYNIIRANGTQLDLCQKCYDELDDFMMKSKAVKEDKFTDNIKKNCDTCEHGYGQPRNYYPCNHCITTDDNGPSRYEPRKCREE